jgi:hypothetical protein
MFQMIFDLCENVQRWLDADERNGKIVVDYYLCVGIHSCLCVLVSCCFALQSWQRSNWCHDLLLDDVQVRYCFFFTIVSLCLNNNEKLNR